MMMMGVFVLCVGTGWLAGRIFLTNNRPTMAASNNISVEDNDQIVTVDQATTVTIIEKTSIVTVKDTTAEYGYNLAARLAVSTMQNVSATIGSADSTTCTLAAPCALPTNGAPIFILSTTTNMATQTNGETTTWLVRLTIPANTAVGNYTLDIEYGEEPVVIKCPVLSGKTYMQEVTPPSVNGPYGTPNERATLMDRRNNQSYYVQNIVYTDGVCQAWMETNLRYGGDGDWNSAWGYPDDRYANNNDSDGIIPTDTATVYDDVRPLILQNSIYGYMGNSSNMTQAFERASYSDPYTLRPSGGDNLRGSLDYTNTSVSGGFYGYHYNWCAAMGGQPNACNGTETSQANLDTSTSICPAGWRLPTGDGGVPANEFLALNNAVNGGSTDSPAGLVENFLAVYSGSFGAIIGIGNRGDYWSSTVISGGNAKQLRFYDTRVTPGTYSGLKYEGFAIRCVLAE